MMPAGAGGLCSGLNIPGGKRITPPGRSAVPLASRLPSEGHRGGAVADKVRWDYRIEEIINGPHQGQLRSWGADGWELVSEVVLSEDRGQKLIRSVFKRPRD